MKCSIGFIIIKYKRLERTTFCFNGINRRPNSSTSPTWMSIKINFVRGDEILTTTMSVGRTMLDAAKKLKIPEIPAICNGSCNCGTCHVHIDPEWVDKIEPMDPGSMELFMLERSDHFDENRSRLCCQMDIYDVYDCLLYTSPSPRDRG